MSMINRIKDMLVLAVLAVLLFRGYNGNHTIKDCKETDTLRVVYDTIPYYKPEPKLQKPLANITAKLPVSVPKFPENGRKTPESVPNSRDSVENFSKNVPDSADVVIPITQKVYEDSTYTAYVSGYNPQLDSLIFRMPKAVVTIREYQKPKRWGVGLQVGYGMTVRGTPQFTPYIGIGVSYNLLSF